MVSGGVLVVCALSLLLVSCGGGGGGDSDDYEAPVVESGNTTSESGSTTSESGSAGGAGSGGGSTSPSVPEGFVSVPGATFNGTTAITGSEVFISERTITIPNLLVCDHEVTQGEYEQYCSYDRSQPSSTYGDGNNYPAYYVSWYDAITYCNKRSLAENLTPCYTVSGVDFSSDVTVPSSIDNTWDAVTCNFSANGYRLPTEAEWEYLARGGNLTNSGQTLYSGSNEIGDVAWYTVNAENVGRSSPDYGTHQIKTKNPNGKNLYDMSGNVWEWCWDWCGSISASTDSAGASSDSSCRVYRGGSWSHGASICSVAYRNSYYPYDHRDTIGFRVVRTAN